MEDQTKKEQRSWWEAEDDIWISFRRWERIKRDGLWVLAGLLLMVVGSYTGFPARLIVGCSCR
jgi:hypothetical protein